MPVHIALPLRATFNPHCFLGAVGRYAHVADHRVVHLYELRCSCLLLSLLPHLSPLQSFRLFLQEDFPTLAVLKGETVDILGIVAEAVPGVSGGGSQLETGCL